MGGPLGGFYCPSSVSVRYLAQNGTSNVRHVATKVHGDATAGTNDSRLFLVLGLWGGQANAEFPLNSVFLCF